MIDAINRLRDRVGELMKPHGIIVGREDVIATRQGGAGYQLARTITVRGKISAHPPVAAADREPTAEERHRWIIAQVESGKPLRRADLEKQFGISTATAKRDFNRMKRFPARK